ncbi:hypothetical protein DEU56DRAFT_905365 [Suillus clintonianus]|uniref:uncharacterized protein n=1 Tax=Suillus clintonianus TaxID=1904413 RepID=UPI001B85FCDA|nr:uncharacterized protein DEU56DRAFT_905365 [Suillus clintonianus]KAG2114410.1 hypothetical protein DEU56DRAFT_905365 [Suillus clintonianus]
MTDGIEFQTSNKPVHVDQVSSNGTNGCLCIEKDSRPCEPSSRVRVSVSDALSWRGTPLIRDVRWRNRSEKSRLTGVGECHSYNLTAQAGGSRVPVQFTVHDSSSPTYYLLMTHIGHGLLARYRRTQNTRDLDESITHFERASDLCAMGHPCRPAALFNLASAKFVNDQVNGTCLDLDIFISLFQNASDFRPTDHPDRSITQLHFAIAMLSHFAKRGFQMDADGAEQFLSKVLDVCHANSHIYRAALLLIETLTFALHRAGGMEGHDLGQKQPDALMLPLSPNQLARRAERCFQGDDYHDLDEVISLHYDALHYYDTIQGLDDAITLLREASCHAFRPTSLFILANVLRARFRHRGNYQDLDEAITLHREALALRSVGHADRSLSLHNLANALSTHFRHQDKIKRDYRTADIWPT